MKRPAAIILLAAFILLAGCAGGETGAPELLEPAVVDPDTAVVYRGEIYNVTCIEGEVVSEVDAYAFSSGGPVAEVFAYTGLSVKAGDVLARLDVSYAEEMVRTFTDSLEQTEQSNYYINKQSLCDIEIAELNLEAMGGEGASKDADLQALYLRNLRSSYSAQVAGQNLALQSTRSALEEYEAIVASSVITAERDGTVIYCSVMAGGYAAFGMDVLWVAVDGAQSIKSEYINTEDIEDADEIYATAGGERVEITNIPYDRATYLSLLARSMELETTFAIDDADSGVESGMIACISIISDRVEDALIIPAGALMGAKGEFFVYLVSDAGVQIKAPVEVGTVTESLVQITTGLEEGDVVFVGA